ncbi:YcnI family protein [Nocardia sp. NRRL S-836]|uniref:YcnI family copper-binding membrane protein n=1 Tax=Nocardia sp. NRRL S-836 TaxID=1519492 RepID=UPI0006AFA3FD|nr:YcnI family protein [Nocardia sp. NRRL S-836]KOV88922.1 nuclear export factor GLE1 [Nocardia sp. NRRL S-836]
MSTNRFGVRTLAVFAVAGIAVLGTPAVASAHVSAQPAEFTQGGRATFAFRVPNERDNAGTIKIEVTLPQDTPLTSVRTKPLAGWKAEVVKGKLDKPVTVAGKEITEAYKTITWTAEPGTKIGTTEYQEFYVALGTLPEKDTLLLPTKQTYENGEVVDWSQAAGADGKEPEHPAPALKLAPKKAGDDGHGGHGTTPAANSADTHEASAGGADQTARYLGGAGLAVGALGLGFGVGAVLRSRRKA